MRPANLIPPEQRRGRHLPGAVRPPRAIGVYLLLAGLGLSVLGVTALVLTSNKVNDQKEEIAKLNREEASAKAAADALRPYGTFAQMQRARVATVRSLAASSFNWERVMRAFSRTIPSDTWVVSFKGSVSPAVKAEATGGGGAGTVGSLRDQSPAPALEIVGCTYSHRSVARMMTRMRNLDGVTQVVLGSSERPEGASEKDQGGGGGGAAGGGGGGDECRTKYHITRFDILVVLGEATYSAPAPASTPAATGAASSIAKAQSATTTASQTGAASTGAGQ